MLTLFFISLFTLTSNTKYFSNTNETKDTNGYFNHTIINDNYFYIKNEKLNKGIMTSMIILLGGISILLITQKIVLLKEVLINM